ncbi:MAG: hypothetical protein ACI8YQ_004402 [Polaribacter sp.]|jgi:hypothetical protein
MKCRGIAAFNLDRLTIVEWLWVVKITKFVKKMIGLVRFVAIADSTIGKDVLVEHSKLAFRQLLLPQRCKGSQR